MDGSGGPLRSWERIYWGVFVSAIAYFLYTRISGKDEGTAIDPEVIHIPNITRLATFWLYFQSLYWFEGKQSMKEGLNPKGF